MLHINARLSFTDQFPTPPEIGTQWYPPRLNKAVQDRLIEGIHASIMFDPFRGRALMLGFSITSRYHAGGVAVLRTSGPAD